MRSSASALVAWSALVALLGLGCFEPDHSLIPPAKPVEVTSGLNPGDTFEVRVFGEEDIGGHFQVQEDGSIVFPLIGRVAVAGTTQGQLAAMLEQQLADGYLRDPQVTVVMTARENLEVSVLGQVNKAGSFDYRDGLTVVQAVSLAGGPGAFAAPARVKVTRRTGVGDETVTFEVSLPAIFNGKAEDLVLRPGDIVFVPESRI